MEHGKGFALGVWSTYEKLSLLRSPSCPSALSCYTSSGWVRTGGPLSLIVEHKGLHLSITMATSDFKRTASPSGGLHMTDSQGEPGHNHMTLSKATLELVRKHVHCVVAAGSEIILIEAIISLMQEMKKRIFLQETMPASSSSNRLSPCCEAFLAPSPASGGDWESRLHCLVMNQLPSMWGPAA